MRYFKNPTTDKAYAIPDEKGFLVHSDWSEISEEEYVHLIDDDSRERDRIAPEFEVSPQRVKEIMTRLKEIDDESIRPLRAITTQSDKLQDHQKLDLLNKERTSLLIELKHRVQPNHCD